ncbi:hypothetical protein N9H39_07765 [Gammaproteobacteria bacterium]|nr:hypothetical protein [Gammaproteobacteria bacterium]
MNKSEKNMERRLRRRLNSKGYTLWKSRRARDRGKYAILDRYSNTVVQGVTNCELNLTLKNVEEWADTLPDGLLAT